MSYAHNSSCLQISRAEVHSFVRSKQMNIGSQQIIQSQLTLHLASAAE
jgi:hypothetical protein